MAGNFLCYYFITFAHGQPLQKLITIQKLHQFKLANVTAFARCWDGRKKKSFYGYEFCNVILLFQCCM